MCSLFTMLLDYKMTRPFTLQLQNRKNCLDLGQCLIILGKWQREAYLSFTLDLVCGSYFETQQAVWRSEIIEYDVTVALSAGPVLRTHAWCHFSLPSNTAQCYLNYFVHCQINMEHVFHSSQSRQRKTSSYRPCRWIFCSSSMDVSSASVCTLLQLFPLNSLKSWKVHIDQVICWHGIALSCEKASWLQLSAVMLRYQ